MSDLINLLIKKITITDFVKTKSLLEFRAFNGSIIPFIGPQWIDVDFSIDYCHISCVDYSFRDKLSKYVGFNEDLNFDHYPYFTIDGDDWNSIKSLFAQIYCEFNTVNPKYNMIDTWLGKINSTLIELSFKRQIIRD